MKNLMIGMALLVAGVAMAEETVSYAIFRGSGKIWGSTNYTCMIHSSLYAKEMERLKHKDYRVYSSCNDPDCPMFRSTNPDVGRWYTNKMCELVSPTNVVWIVGSTNAQWQLNWRLCTNWPAYKVGVNSGDTQWFTTFSGTNLMYATNIVGYGWGYDSRRCTKDHVDLSPQEDVYVVTSNLFSRIQWRGESKETCLEMLPVTNYVRHWSNVVEKRYKD